jgi:hypothetical protein
VTSRATGRALPRQLLDPQLKSSIIGITQTRPHNVVKVAEPCGASRAHRRRYGGGPSDSTATTSPRDLHHYQPGMDFPAEARGACIELMTAPLMRVDGT